MMEYRRDGIGADQLPPAVSDNRIRFLWCTDSHIHTMPAISSAHDVRVHYLDAAIDAANAWRPDFFLHTGDIGNNRTDRTRFAFFRLMRCRVPQVLVIGNHDEWEPTSGNPDTSAITEMYGAFDGTVRVVTSGDTSWSLVVITLDWNHYDDDPAGLVMSAQHEPGDRVGEMEPQIPSSYYRMLGTAQRNWLAATLATTAGDALAIMMHYPPNAKTTDHIALADILQADGRPVIGFCGHGHEHAQVFPLTSTDELVTYSFYKAPSIQDCQGWVQVALSFDDDLVIDQMALHNYNPPGAWIVQTPFTVAV